MDRNCSCQNNEKEELFNEIQELNFSVIELGLYLDINPTDSRALCLHNKYANELRKLTDKYESMFGPLSIATPCNSWRWLDEPWPWEKGGND